MTEDYIFHDEDLHDQIIAMDNTLTKKATKFSVEEQRLFYSSSPLPQLKPSYLLMSFTAPYLNGDQADQT